MSDPYGYSQPPQSGYPPQGYQPSYGDQGHRPQQDYNAGYSPYSQGQSPYPGSHYPPPPDQGNSASSAPGYDQLNYGPPVQGGFQHGQQLQAPHGEQPQYGAPSPHTPQSGYGDQPQYGGQYPPPAEQDQYGRSPNQQFPQQDPYAQGPQPLLGASNQGQYGPTEPSQAGEGERGLLGAAGGAIGGHMLGKQFGNHGLIGTIVGAVAGSIAQDKLKPSHHSPSSSGSPLGQWGGSVFGGSHGSDKKHHHHHHHHGSQY